MHFWSKYLSPLGTMTLVSDAEGENLIGLWIEDQKYFGHGLKGAMAEKAALPLFRKAKAWLDAYFAGEKPGPAPFPLAPRGSDFRREVWAMLCEISYGEVMTYGELARKMAAKMGRPSMSSQAIGGAVGHNPIGILIPCHRMVGANGSLTGFAAGIENKMKLLELEGADLSSFFIPAKGSAL